MSSIHWARMSWRAVEAARERQPVVILPIGTTESQGPYNILGLETVIVERLAETVAERTESLVLPAIPYGESGQFEHVPGTITIRPEVLEGLYEDSLRSAIRHGFDHLLVLGAHLPNQPILSRVFHNIREEEGILVAGLNPGRIAPKYIPDLFDRPAEARGHGAEPGLSLGEYLCPNDVDRTGAEPIPQRTEFRGFEVSGMSLRFEGLDALMAIRVDDVAPEHSGWGDPTQGGAGQGEEMFNRMADVVTAFTERFRVMDTRV